MPDRELDDELREFTLGLFELDDFTLGAERFELGDLNLGVLTLFVFIAGLDLLEEEVLPIFNRFAGRLSRTVLCRTGRSIFVLSMRERRSERLMVRVLFGACRTLRSSLVLLMEALLFDEEDRLLLTEEDDLSLLPVVRLIVVPVEEELLRDRSILPLDELLLRVVEDRPVERTCGVRPLRDRTVDELLRDLSTVLVVLRFFTVLLLTSLLRTRDRLLTSPSFAKPERLTPDVLRPYFLSFSAEWFFLYQ